ncbi:MAG: hypothetical protein AAF985_09430 [Bacteroidota bacterium]
MKCIKIYISLLLIAFGLHLSAQHASEIEHLENKIIELRDKETETRIKIIRTQGLAASRLKAINQLKQIIVAKDLYIETLQRTLAATEDLLEQEELWNEELQELRTRDSIRHELIVAEKEKDIQRLHELFETAQKAYQKEMQRLYAAYFDISFKVTAIQKDNLFKNRINKKMPLNESNSMEVKAKAVEQMFIEFKTARKDSELPDFTFSLDFLSHKGKSVELFKDHPLETKNGEVNFLIDWKESHNKKFKPQKGKYLLVLKFEENQKMITKTYAFKLS